MPLLLYASNLPSAAIVFKTEGTVLADNRLAYFGEPCPVVLHRAVAWIRTFQRSNFGIQFGNLVLTDNQFTTIGEVQLNLAAHPGLYHFAFAYRIAALNAAQFTVCIPYKRSTGNFSNAGDNFGHDTTPA